MADPFSLPSDLLVHIPASLRNTLKQLRTSTVAHFLGALTEPQLRDALCALQLPVVHNVDDAQVEKDIARESFLVNGTAVHGSSVLGTLRSGLCDACPKAWGDDDKLREAEATATLLLRCASRTASGGDSFFVAQELFVGDTGAGEAGDADCGLLLKPAAPTSAAISIEIDGSGAGDDDGSSGCVQQHSVRSTNDYEILVQQDVESRMDQAIPRATVHTVLTENVTVSSSSTSTGFDVQRTQTRHLAISLSVAERPPSTVFGSNPMDEAEDKDGQWLPARSGGQGTEFTVTLELSEPLERESNSDAKRTDSDSCDDGTTVHELGVNLAMDGTSCVVDPECPFLRRSVPRRGKGNWKGKGKGNWKGKDAAGASAAGVIEASGRVHGGDCLVAVDGEMVDGLPFVDVIGILKRAVLRARRRRQPLRLRFLRGNERASMSSPATGTEATTVSNVQAGTDKARPFSLLQSGLQSLRSAAAALGRAGGSSSNTSADAQGALFVEFDVMLEKGPAGFGVNLLVEDTSIHASVSADTPGAQRLVVDARCPFAGTAHVGLHTGVDQSTQMGPAEQCGKIEPGDILVALDGRALLELRMSEVLGIVRAASGPTVLRFRRSRPVTRAGADPQAITEAKRAATAVLAQGQDALLLSVIDVAKQLDRDRLQVAVEELAELLYIREVGAASGAGVDSAHHTVDTKSCNNNGSDQKSDAETESARLSAEAEEWAELLVSGGGNRAGGNDGGNLDNRGEDINRAVDLDTQLNLDLGRAEVIVPTAAVDKDVDLDIAEISSLLGSEPAETSDVGGAYFDLDDVESGDDDGNETPPEL